MPINNSDNLAARKKMVEKQLIPRGITDKAVISGMLQVPRHEFVPDHLKIYAYEDRPLPIDQGQTISQPYMVGFMVQSLELNENSRVLEIGTGSGYGAAVLSRVAEAVYTIERHKSLYNDVEKLFQKLKYKNINVRLGDGYHGWGEEAPFDGIVVTAAPSITPKPLLEQLAPGGHLVIPLGEGDSQELVRMRKNADDSFEEEKLGQVRFVPLIST